MYLLHGIEYLVFELVCFSLVPFENLYIDLTESMLMLLVALVTNMSNVHNYRLNVNNLCKSGSVRVSPSTTEDLK